MPLVEPPEREAAPPDLAEQGQQMPQMFAQIGMIIGIAFMVVLGFGWPFFLIVWFLRAKVREEVERWREHTLV